MGKQYISGCHRASGDTKQGARLDVSRTTLYPPSPALAREVWFPAGLGQCSSLPEIRGWVRVRLGICYPTPTSFLHGPPFGVAEFF